MHWAHDRSNYEPSEAGTEARSPLVPLGGFRVLIDFYGAWRIGRLSKAAY